LTRAEKARAKEVARLASKQKVDRSKYATFLRKYAANFEAGDYPKPTMEEWKAAQAKTWAIYHGHKPEIMRAPGGMGWCSEHEQFFGPSCPTCLEIEEKRQKLLFKLETKSLSEIRAERVAKTVEYELREGKRRARFYFQSTREDGSTDAPHIYEKRVQRRRMEEELITRNPFWEKGDGGEYRCFAFGW